uniref:Hexosyltransferase n=1 Tax=viral metagenome TaxID=1070528 RepID=A0A6C0LRQ1_9ZZZZ
MYSSITYAHVDNKLAYVFALVGKPTKNQAATHLAAIDLLKQTGSMIDTISMQSPNNIRGLRHALRVLGTKIVTISNELVCNCRRSIYQIIFNDYRFGFSCYILNIWKMIQYDKILYMDGDLAVMRNPDSLFRKWYHENTTELRTPVACNAKPTHNLYNTGFWGITPSYLTYKSMENWLRNADYPCGIGSQTWVNILFASHSFSSASILWNMKADQGIDYCLNKNMKQHTTPYVVHWSGDRKPTTTLRTTDKYEIIALKKYRNSVNNWTRFLF